MQHISVGSAVSVPPSPVQLKEALDGFWPVPGVHAWNCFPSDSQIYQVVRTSDALCRYRGSYQVGGSRCVRRGS